MASLAPGQAVNFRSTRAKDIFFKGNSVEIDARGYGDSATFVANLTAQGMQVTSTAKQGGLDDRRGPPPGRPTPGDRIESIRR